MGLFGSKPEDPAAMYIAENETKTKIVVITTELGDEYEFDSLTFEEVSEAIRNARPAIESIDVDGERVGIVVSRIVDWYETAR